MNQPLVDQIAAAVLYEGYMLYPYRPSVKNRQRWTFGGLYPEAYSKSQEGCEPCAMQTECLVLGGSETTIHVSVRFLQLVARLVGQCTSPLHDWPEEGEPSCQMVESLQVGDVVHHAWQEAVEHKISLGDSNLLALVARTTSARIPPHRRARAASRCATRMVRLSGSSFASVDRSKDRVELSAVAVEEGTFRLSVKVLNQTPWKAEDTNATRDEALMHSLVSTHTVLGVSDGEFVSMIDPPEPHPLPGGRMSEHRHLAGPRRGRRCKGYDHSQRRSSSMTIRKSPRRVPATCSTAPRSTRSSRSES